MNVCHLIDTLSAGGAENMVLNIANGMDDSVTTSVCYLDEPDTLRAEFEDAGVEVIELGEREMYHPLTISALYRELSNRDVDVLHTHLPASIVFGRIVGRLTRVSAVVSTQHNVTGAYSDRSMLLERLTRPLDSKTVPVSESVKKTMKPSLRDDLEVIYNGVNVAEFSLPSNDYLVDTHDIDPTDTVLLNVGRYVPQKSQLQLIDAMDEFTATRSDVHLFIVGWGDLEAELKTRVETLGLTDHVTITGFVDDVTDYYRNADVFVSSSRYEGLPVTLLEAMAAGLPIVGTDVPGTSDVVEDRSTGLLVKYGDTDAMASGCIELLDESRREKFAKQAFDHVSSKFSIEATISEYLELYRQLVDSKANSGL